MMVHSRVTVRRSKIGRFVHSWLTQIFDPVRMVKGLCGFIWYLKDWRHYKGMDGVERMRFIDSSPQVHDRTSTSAVDRHYFYVNGWAMRRITKNKPRRHIDVGSDISLVNLLAAVIPVTFVDYRPLNVALEGLECIGGSILEMPFADDSIESLSCLHVAEHIGLGRYGDSLDPLGTVKAAHELGRILAPGGYLYLAVPIGKPRLCFNAHRIHGAETICGYFSELRVVEFCGVHDDGRFIQGVRLSEFDDSEYACGMFLFKKEVRQR